MYHYTHGILRILYSNTQRIGYLVLTLNGFLELEHAINAHFCLWETRADVWTIKGNKSKGKIPWERMENT